MNANPVTPKIKQQAYVIVDQSIQQDVIIVLHIQVLVQIVKKVGIFLMEIV